MPIAFPITSRSLLCLLAKLFFFFEATSGSLAIFMSSVSSLDIALSNHLIRALQYSVCVWFSVNCSSLSFNVSFWIVHSHKKRNGRLKASLDRVLFSVELEFSKILVPRLPQNSSNVNNECAGQAKQLYSLCDQLFWALMYLHFIILILICF